MTHSGTFVRLGNVCEYERQIGVHGGLPYLGLEHIESGTGRFDLSPSNSDAKSQTFRFSSAHLLYGRLRPYLKKVALPESEGRCSTEIFPILPKTGMDRRYLAYWLLSDETTESINATCTGARMPRADMGAVLDLRIFAPALPEQHRIVGILDEAFAGIATARANAERNRKNAREVFEGHLQSAFNQGGDGWMAKPLGEVCEVKDGTHDSPKYVEVGIPFVTQKNIREGGLSFEKTKLISQVDHDNFYRRSNVARGDILISMIGANRGMACLVDDDRVFSIKNVGLVKNNSAVNQSYLLYFLRSPQATGYVQAASKGGAQEFVGLAELRRWPVPIPAPETQNSIVFQLDALASETQHLESLYTRKLAALDELKQSLLQQAFSGAL